MLRAHAAMSTLQLKDATTLRGQPPPPSTTATSGSSSTVHGIRTWSSLQSVRGVSDANENTFKLPGAPASATRHQQQEHQAQRQPGAMALNGSGAKRKSVMHEPAAVKVHRRQSSTVDQPFSTPLSARSANVVDTTHTRLGLAGSIGLSSSSSSSAAAAAGGSALLSSSSSSSLSSTTTTSAIPANKALSTLVLAPFQPSPWIDFGKVLVGHKKTATLYIENPTDTPERIRVDASCRMEEKGFNIDPLDPLLQQQQQCVSDKPVEPLTVPAQSTIEVTVSWTPFTGGAVRASAILKSASGRFMVNLHGCGETIPTPIPVDPMKASMLGKSRYGQKRKDLRESVMMRQSIRKDGVYTPPPGYSTLPYVTTNEMYDERWIDRQERSFSQWLNHEFHVTVDTFSPRDPSSWSYYSHKLEYEHTRAAAFKIYQSDTFKVVLLKVEDSLAKERLKIRQDCNLVGDVSTRCEVMDLLFSYDIRWLVLGLETTTGMATSVTPSFDRSMISTFINKTIFHDKSLEREYEPDRILSNRAKFQKAMNKLVLKRLFMMILFLDKAKQGKLIPSDPCLFNKESDIKSSRQMLTTISKRYLMGEGDIIRHLLFMGYSVLHTQEPLDEYDFTVKNLAVDMRDGIRLCRLVDLHCPDLNLGSKMKFPTLSKTHMQQNVNLALNALVSQGIALEGTRGGTLTARDIVEGHREKTFGLLWKLILNWKVPVLVDIQSLLGEIAAIKKEYRKMYGKEQPERIDTVYFTSEQLSALLRWCQAIGTFYGLHVSNFTTSFSDGRAFGALLSYYHPALLDMGEMKDSAKYLAEVKQGLHQDEAKLPSSEEQGGKGWFIDVKELVDPVTTAKEMDRFNYRLLNSKVQALGGVPITMRHSDQSHIGVPDEKAVILFVTYLCARLMHLNKDIRAAKTIQRLWRRKRYGDLQEEERRRWAAVVLQRALRRYQARKRAAEARQRAREQAVRLIQTGCRGYLARRRAMMQLERVCLVQRQCRAFLWRKQWIEYRWAALTMQRWWRGLVARRQVAAYRHVCAVQAQVRGYLVRKRVLMQRLAVEVVTTRRQAQVVGRQVRQAVARLRWAAVVIQRRWRAQVQGRQVRAEFLGLRAWATNVQASVRAALVRRRYYRMVEEMHWAALVVQRRRRGLVATRTCMQRLADVRWAASVVQARWRAQVQGRQVREAVAAQRAWIVAVQAQGRRWLVQRRYWQLMQAAVVVQTRWRAELAMRAQRELFLWQRAAACVLQDRWRAVLLGRATRDAYQQVRSAVVGVQAAIRGYQLRQRVARVLQEHQAAVTIQAAWRGHVARQEVRALRAVVGVQAMVRAKMVRWEYERLRQAALVVQQRWRARQVAEAERAEMAELIMAAMVLQRRWRALVVGRQVRDHVAQVYHGIVLLQAQVRGVLARTKADRMRWLVRVQAAIRGGLVRREVARVLEQERREQAARLIQDFWRSTVERRTVRYAYEELRWAAMVVQRRWRQVVYERAELAAAQEQAAILIQTAVRGFLVRQQVAAYLEDRYRVMHQWVTLTEQWMSAIVLQRAWRRREQRRRRAELEHFAASKIQAWWQYRRTVRIQSQLERIMTGVQAQVRGALARMRADRAVAAAVTLQSWWRGHVVRREASAKIRAAWKRIEHANATAEEHMKLGNRTTMALDILLSSGQLSSVLKACYHLDVVTRLSKNSCLRLVEHNVVNIIFRLIQSCNRSQPHMEVLKHGLNIVENLSRDPDTMAAVFWAPEGMEILVGAAQAYRENEMVLESVMTILLLHLQGGKGDDDEGRRRAATLCKRMPGEVKKLRGVLTVLERKLEREMKSHGGPRYHHHPSQGATGAGGAQQLAISVNKLRKVVQLLASSQ